jgi:flavorubredoxin
MARKVYVVYASLTGNTRKVAQAIAGAVGGALVDVRKDPLPKVESGDVIFVGDGVYGWRPSRAMRRALSSWALPKGVKAAVFGTYGGKPAQLGVLEKILRGKGRGSGGSFLLHGPGLVLPWVDRPGPALGGGPPGGQRIRPPRGGLTRPKKI